MCCDALSEWLAFNFQACPFCGESLYEEGEGEFCPAPLPRRLPLRPRLEAPRPRPALNSGLPIFPLARKPKA